MPPVSHAAVPPAALDHTHDAAARSWVDGADEHPQFPLQNLPMGVMEIEGAPRVVTAIGEQVLDLPAAQACGALGALTPATVAALGQPELNAWMALSAAERTALRHAVFALLSAEGEFSRRPAAERLAVLRPAREGRALLPARIGDYTDFYAGIHHATNAGRFFRPDMPLLPNYKHVPIGYHGRSSTIEPSGAPVHRPQGQLRPAADAPPVFEPSRKLDFELELAIWVSGGNRRGQAIPMDEADAAIAGFGLLNDWSARDIQAWEYQPLGPFLAKNFLSTVSPWVVTADAMAPFRAPPMARQADDPQPLPYLLGSQGPGLGLDIALEVTLSTEAMRAQGLAPQRLSRSNAAFLWWTPAQLLAHHSSGGCALRPGDLFGSGTISGEQPDSLGSLLELTQGGRQALRLASGEERLFLQAGDELSITGRCERAAFRAIGLGTCSGRVQD
jgi:fumarylacetoacetase